MEAITKTLIGAAIVGLFAVSSASAEQIRVGFAAEPYPPFASPDATGNWEGWEVDFMNAACAEAKLDCTIVGLSYDGLIPALNANKIDMIIASVSITDERKKTIDFSDPYYKTAAALIGPKGVELEVDPAGLNGKTIGVQAGSIHQAYANQYFVPAGATVKGYQTQDEAYSDLASGRIDAVQGDIIALDGFLKTEQGISCCELKGNVKDDPSILGNGVGVGIRKGDGKLLDAVNAAIKAIRANGKYQEFSKKYFDFDVFGG